MAGREGERARALELAAERLVFAFGGLDDLGVEALQRLAHALERGVDGAGEGGVDLAHGLAQRPATLRHLPIRLVERALDVGRQLTFEQTVERDSSWTCRASSGT